MPMTDSDPTTTTPPSSSREHPLGAKTSPWKLWGVRIVVFCVMFAFLMVAFAALGSLVERFFVALYVD